MKHATLIIGCILTLAASAQAVMIENLTTSTLLFYDDYENPSITPSTANAFDSSVDADPIAVVGGWNTPEANVGDVGIFQVTSSTASPDPVPYQGQRDLRVYRSGAHNNHDGQASLTSVQSNPGNVIKLTMMVYIPTSEDIVARGQFLLAGNTLPGGSGYLSARAWVIPGGDGFVHTVGPAFADVTTAVTYSTNVWQEWTLTYAVNDTSFAFSVNGVPGTGTSYTSGSVYGAELFNGNNFAGSVYLDIPEPASAALLTIGSAVMLRRRRAV